MLTRIAKLRLLRGEEGQSIILVALCMVALIAITGVVIDAGRLYLAQRELQTAADAAALAGVEALPDGATAQTDAITYSASSGSGTTGLNAVSGLSGDNVQTSSELECVSEGSAGASCLQGASGSGCDVALPPSGGVGCNALKVTETATVPLTLLNILGLSSWTVHASSTATLGGVSEPVDLEVVIDTTASMGDHCSSTVPGITNTSSTPTKLDCADYGVRTLLSELDPCQPGAATCGPDVSGNDVANPLDRVGLMVFGGLNSAKGFATGATGVPQELGCSKNIDTADLTYGSDALYQIVPFSSDYRSSDTAGLNDSSNLVKAVYWAQCPGGVYPGPGSYGVQDPGGIGTYYAGAITAAQQALVSDGRSAQKVIVLLSDGDANTMGPNACQAGLDAAEAAEQKGTVIYTIAYDSPTGATPASCSTDSPAQAAICIMHEMADNSVTDPPYGTNCVDNSSDPTHHFFNQPGDDLSVIFGEIGESLSSPRLISNNAT